MFKATLVRHGQQIRCRTFVFFVKKALALFRKIWYNQSSIQRNGSVHAVDIANELEFSKPSVSVAMKNLRENGYIAVDRNNEITLTDAGKKIAETIYERHTLLSSWLQALGVSAETAAEDACRMEHVISAESFAAIKRHAEAGNPKSEKK